MRGGALDYLLGRQVDRYGSGVGGVLARRRRSGFDVTDGEADLVGGRVIRRVQPVDGGEVDLVAGVLSGGTARSSVPFGGGRDRTRLDRDLAGGASAGSLDAEREKAVTGILEAVGRSCGDHLVVEHDCDLLVAAAVVLAVLDGFQERGFGVGCAGRPCERDGAGEHRHEDDRRERYTAELVGRACHG